jgi:hypothetical protein
MGRVGYVASHWAHGPRWAVHSLLGDHWFGLDCVPVLEEPDWEILLVPLLGHSRGHCGDAYVRQMHVVPDHPRSPFPRWAAPLAHCLFPEAPLERLRSLLRDHGDQIQAFPAHDREALAQRQAARQAV